MPREAVLDRPKQVSSPGRQRKGDQVRLGREARAGILMKA